MADQKISQLPEQTTAKSTDEFPIVDAGTNKRAALSTVQTLLKTAFDLVYQPLSAVLTATTASFTTTLESKLDGIASGATANDTDANLKNRANHTGSQTASTISDFDTEVANNAAVAANTAKNSYPSADAIKVGHLTVTQAVDLDTIESRVNELDASVILKGAWDASVGTFPGGGTAQAGHSYVVSVGGTVGGVEFTANDRIVAITDNASTSVYASNWLKLDYTDAVLSVDGNTGAVDLSGTYQPLHALLTSIAALVPGAEGKMITSDGLGGYQSSTVTEVRAYLNVENGATGDQTGAEIKSAYEGEADTNAFTDAEKTKVGYISVTQAVDLDQMETDIAALANGMVYKGNWDASAGTFPGAGSAQTGWFYYVSVAGTVDGVEFAIGDNIVATTDNASTSTYAANWSKHDQTDAVQSVAGKTGAVTLVTDDVTESTDKNYVTDAEKVVIGNTSGTNSGDEPTATDEAKGVVELSTDAEAVTGTSDDVVTTPGNLTARLAAPGTIGGTTPGAINHTYAVAGVSALGNLGSTEAIDWATASHFTGTLDANVTITHSNEAAGEKITLALSYDGSAQRTITWSDVDTWLDNNDGSAPATPSGSGEILIVTLIRLGTTVYATAAGNYAVYA
jgi:hypothetical protein